MTRPLRVLHVVGRMNHGGIENWLVQVLRAADRDRLQLDFLTTSAEPGHYDAELLARGARLFRCPLSGAPVAFARRFLAVARDGGFDVVHSHLHHFSGVVLALARHAGVPVRIAHSHNDTARDDARAGLLRAVYLRATEAAVRRFATRGLAASALAAEALYGPRWREDGRWRISHYGLDFSAFRQELDREAVRAELGLPGDAKVVGHVGRFDRQKNHAFLLRIAAEVIRAEPRAWFVLVGEGALRAAMEAEAERLGIRDRVLFAGARSDVPRVLRAFDAFLMPSFHEGLPLVGLEAQAAGLPLVLSDTITRELEAVPELFTWRSLSEPPATWAASVRATLGRRTDPDRALASLEESDFSIRVSVRTLEETYGSV